MRLLLDTHAFLWFYAGDERLGATSKALIDNPDNECFLSIASVWEMGVKTSIGKLELRVDFAGLASFMAANKIELLPISFGHIQQLQHLPFYHRDQFDRLLIAQAVTENLTLLSRDTIFPQYRISLVW
jgi:PIN domain nuclease of toxin-antitoxin system